MAVAIKICGIREPAIIDAAITLGCDYAGLVFFPRSPRNISVEQAARLAAHARGRIKTVAVTVDAGDALLSAIAAQVKPDFLQLHGSETDGRMTDMKKRFGIPLIRAVKVRSVEDIIAAAGAFTAADMLLFDARSPGSGKTFDWTLLQNRSIPLPWFVSGGLKAENVAEALHITGAKAVDVSSGVESTPGVKDIQKMQEFVKAVHGVPTTR